MANRIPESRWVWFGQSAHFIAAHSCQFHLATLVGNFVVSTVGDYYPLGSEEPQNIGAGRKYETMVFRFTWYCDCGCGLPLIDASELDFLAAHSAKEANLNHRMLCEKASQGKYV